MKSSMQSPSGPAVEQRGPALDVGPMPPIDGLIAASSIGAGLANIRENGIGAELADLEAEMAAPRKRRKSRATYSARTIAECVRRGWIAGNVERRIPFPKPRGTTIDLFGVIDIIACDLSAPLGQRTIGIQATSGGTGGAVAPHRAKILAEPRARQWVEAGNRLELWSWAKQGARGKRKRWTLRIQRFIVENGVLTGVEQ